MVTFKAKQDDIFKWYPKTTDLFIKELRNSESVNRNYSASKIQWFVNWGFMVKKPKTDEEKLNRQASYDAKLKLAYEERLKVEIPRIKVDIAFKAGHYFRSDRVIEPTPDFIIDMATEVIKMMMVQEQKELNDPIVLASMSEFMHLFNEDEKGNSEPILDLDSILDKIAEDGMGSLTPKELKFLEKKSKGN